MRKAFFTLSLLFISIAVFAQTSVSGVVTYFFNDNYGNKPDIGSQVSVIDSTNAAFINMQSYDTLMRGIYFKNDYNTYKEDIVNVNGALDDFRQMSKRKHKDEIAFCNAQLLHLDSMLNSSKDSMLLYKGDEGKDKTQLTDRIYEMYSRIREDNSIQRAVDGNGSYTINLKAGTYYIFIKSSQRKGSNLAEMFGMIYLKKFNIKPDQQKDISHNFNVDD